MLVYRSLAPATSSARAASGGGLVRRRAAAAAARDCRPNLAAAHRITAKFELTRTVSSSTGFGPASPPTATASSVTSAGITDGGGTSSAAIEAARLSRRRLGGELPFSVSVPPAAADSSSTFADVSDQAREISSRVPSSSTSSSSSISIGSRPAKKDAAAAARPVDIANASEAADALLALTASPALRTAFASRSKISSLEIVNEEEKKKEKNASLLGQDTVEAVHFSFISVSSWLQSSISVAAASAAAEPSTATPSQDQVDAAIIKCIELTVRSTDLDLPLTVPLYSSLAKIVAQHSSPSCQPRIQIIEVANLLRIALHPQFNPPPASFFHDSCISLTRRGLIREAIGLLDELDCEFGIVEVDAVTGLEMLSAVAEGLGLDDNSKASIVFGSKQKKEQEKGNSSSSTIEYDPVDATELVFRLRGPLLRQLDEVSTQLRDEMEQSVASGADAALEGAATNSELVDLLERLSAEEEDTDSDEVTNDDNDVVKILGDDEDSDENDIDDDDSSMATLADVETLSDAVHSLSDDGPSGTTQRYTSLEESRRLPQGLHDKMAREMVYVRRGPEWELPDLVNQLSELDGGREVLYAREYEEGLIQKMIEEEDEED